jgi:hypothetical protein
MEKYAIVSPISVWACNSGDRREGGPGVADFLLGGPGAHTTAAVV